VDHARLEDLEFPTAERDRVDIVGRLLGELVLDSLRVGSALELFLFLLLAFGLLALVLLLVALEDFVNVLAADLADRAREKAAFLASMFEQYIRDERDVEFAKESKMQVPMPGTTDAIKDYTEFMTRSETIPMTQPRISNAEDSEDNDAEESDKE
jgi:hypothetical protein